MALSPSPRIPDHHGKITIEETPWKRKRLEQPCELEKDADGGLRFTDGQKIYELLPQRVGGMVLHTYTITGNSLQKTL